MHLREFLYADVDRVRSLIGQLMAGVPSEARETESKTKNFTAGMKAVLSASGDRKSEVQTTKSLADSLFSDLEEILESEGWLTDISEELAYSMSLEELPDKFPPGSLVRITSPGHLFDARYVARVMSGLSATLEGINSLPGADRAEPVAPSRRAQRESGRRSANDEGTLEAEVRDFDARLLDGIDVDNLKSFIKVSRGVFTPGVHLMLTPRSDEIAISARLQEGRQYLESDAEILFSRYGTGRQEWTLVGSIGAYAEHVDPQNPAIPAFAVDQTVNRSMFAQFINIFIQFVGNQGFADLAQFPGFSVVPIGVYRAVPRAAPRTEPGLGAVV